MTLFQSFQLDEKLIEAFQKKEIHIPTYNLFEDSDAIQFEEIHYVNENLIPVLEYKIKVNKECLHRHKQEWSEIFKIHYEKVLSNPPTWGEILLDSYTRRGILNKFQNYLQKPIRELSQKVLKDHEEES